MSQHQLSPENLQKVDSPFLEAVFYFEAKQLYINFDESLTSLRQRLKSDLSPLAATCKKGERIFQRATDPVAQMMITASGIGLKNAITGTVFSCCYRFDGVRAAGSLTEADFDAFCASLVQDAQSALAEIKLEARLLPKVSREALIGVDLTWQSRTISLAAIAERGKAACSLPTSVADLIKGVVLST